MRDEALCSEYYGLWSVNLFYYERFGILKDMDVDSGLALFVVARATKDDLDARLELD